MCNKRTRGYQMCNKRTRGYQMCNKRTRGYQMCNKRTRGYQMQMMTDEESQLLRSFDSPPIIRQYGRVCAKKRKKAQRVSADVNEIELKEYRLTRHQLQVINS
ncbi:hypothetical protein CAPTEDRAFT_190875 [Capitella teleta]|uniref:Uncharacterized protein n=1 Tax=Capitella teleta TaxID=283909 RepID=R7UP34_CAPTE|nr:hypothetical protein CAPTEDRAFT_190875 [Capitella teleta]|eukprot:ELU08289.1 hypothetical protein CAPTEDRAFT_190875 [Capitella teleta]